VIFLAIQILINIFVAILWMFFQDDWGALSLASGYIVGVIITFSMRRFFNKPFYLYTLYAIIKLFLIFIKETILSGILVIREVIRPQIKITPGIFKLETSLESDVEVTLLSMLITLTPGSVVMEVTPDNKYLYIHAMDIPELRDAVFKSQAVFEKAIKDVTRK